MLLRLLLLFFLELLSCSTSLVLNYTMLGTKLPTPRAQMGVVYNGDDHIYLFGGMIHTPFPVPFQLYSNEILRYTISTDTLSIVAHFPNGENFASNRVTLNSHGKIHTVSVTQNSVDTKICEFDPTTSEVKRLADFIHGSTRPFLQVTDDTAIFFSLGSNNSIIRKMNLETQKEVVLFDQIPEKIRMYYGAFDKENNIIYAVGYIVENYQPQNPFIATFDLNTNHLDFLTGDVPDYSFPSFTIWKDGKMYLFDSQPEGSHDAFVARFDPTALTFDFISVQGVSPVASDLYNGAAVYVEKLNRVYLFGGTSRLDTTFLRDAVGYIDLDE